MKISLSSWTLCIAVAMFATGCTAHRPNNLPPADRLMEPGPGVGGPGPGVMAPAAMTMAPGMVPITQTTVQILFDKPEGMNIQWDVGGVGMFDSDPLVVPGRSTFPQGGIYRLKLSKIEGREGVELYPTLEIAPTTPRTEAYLAHNAIPVQFTEEDWDQVQSVSTRLDPGVDPIVEADRRGSILAIIRLGNKDLEMPGESINEGAMVGTFAGMGADGMCLPGGAMGMPYAAMPPYVAGATAPQWGMPMSGTPIGLPGPPHVPLGIPVGLQSHVIKNHTPMHIPDPASHFRIDVRQQPGYSYPTPPTRMRVKEQNIYPPLRYGMPHNEGQTWVE
jgi:hypothetical protein